MGTLWMTSFGLCGLACSTTTFYATNRSSSLDMGAPANQNLFTDIDRAKDLVDAKTAE